MLMGGGGRECPLTRVGAPFVPLPPPARCRHTAPRPTWRDRSRGARTCAEGCRSARPATTALPPSPPWLALTFVRRGRCHAPPAGIPLRGARCLLAELGCVRFVCASRGPRRRGQDTAWAETSGTRRCRSCCGIWWRRRRPCRKWRDGKMGGAWRRADA
jgi:hypothetical protein